MENELERELGTAEEKSVLDRARERLPQMSKNQRQLTEYICGHYDQAAFLTAARLGGELGISESTVVRYAKALGYEGYPQFQRALEACVKDRLKGTVSVDDGLGEQGSVFPCSVMARDLERVRTAMQGLDPETFETAVSDILEAETVYVMGLRGSEPLASFLHFYLHMIRPGVVLLKSTDVSEIFEQMVRIREKDCFIGISFPRYSLRTLKAMEFANDRNARIISITDSPRSPMNLYTSCCLLAPGGEASIAESLAAPMSLLNALVAALCRRVPEQVKQNLCMLEEAWNNYQVERNDEIDVLDEGVLEEFERQ